MSVSHASLGGSSIQGISPKQTITNYKGGEEVRLRRVVVKSWNKAYAVGTVNDKNRAIGEFRAVSNSGDFLSRAHYNCGGSEPNNTYKTGLRGRFGNMFQNCDGTDIPPSSCNVKYVYDSSDYITFRKQRAVNLLYNDNTFGGDQSHASCVNWMHAKRGVGGA
jgi:hypothetical protein